VKGTSNSLKGMACLGEKKFLNTVFQISNSTQILSNFL
jgi:hypothetical protein